MIAIVVPSEVQADLAQAMREARKSKKHSRAIASKLTGVPYATIRRFEETGDVSLKQFLMLVSVYGDLQQVAKSIRPQDINEPKTMDELIKRSDN